MRMKSHLTNKEEKIMRHIIIRSIMGLVWIGSGVAMAIQGQGTNAILPSVVGAAFLYSAVTMWKKRNKDVQ